MKSVTLALATLMFTSALGGIQNASARELAVTCAIDDFSWVDPISYSVHFAVDDATSSGVVSTDYIVNVFKEDSRLRSFEKLGPLRFDPSLNQISGTFITGSSKSSGQSYFKLNLNIKDRGTIDFKVYANQPSILSPSTVAFGTGKFNMPGNPHIKAQPTLIKDSTRSGSNNSNASCTFLSL